MTVARATLLTTFTFLLALAGGAWGHRTLQESCTTVAMTADEAGLTTLLAAASIAGLAGPLSDPAWASTVLAPTNEAFEAAAHSLNITIPELLASPDLAPILRYHLVDTPLDIDELLVAGTVNTEFESQDLTIAGEMIDDSAIITISSPVTSATVIKDNIIACKRCEVSLACPHRLLKPNPKYTFCADSPPTRFDILSAWQQRLSLHCSDCPNKKAKAAKEPPRYFSGRH